MVQGLSVQRIGPQVLDSGFKALARSGHWGLGFRFEGFSMCFGFGSEDLTMLQTMVAMATSGNCLEL